MIDKLYKIVKIVIGIFLAIFLGNKLFSFIPVYAYSTSGFTYASQIYLAGIVNDSEYVGNGCTSGDFCGITINGEAETQIFRAYYNSSFSFKQDKTYNFTFMVADTCKYFGTENGEKWYVRYGTGTSAVYPEMLHSSCTTHEDGYSTIKLTFKSPSSTTLSQINISHSYPGYLVFPIHNYNVAFSRFYKFEEIVDFSEQIYNEQQQTNEKLDQTNDNLNDLKEQEKETYDYLTDETEPSSDISSLGNVQGLLPAGPVDSLLNIPFKFLSVVNSSFGGVCKPLEGPFVYDSTLTLPCFSEVFYDEVPPLLLNFLSLIPASWILISYFKHLYKKVNRAVSMETNADDEWGVL